MTEVMRSRESLALPERGLAICLGYPWPELLELRTEYVVAMGWFDSNHTDDTDEYDGRDDTIHICDVGADGKVLAGMRLTKTNFFGSLSLSMLESNLEMYEDVIRYHRSETAEVDGEVITKTENIDSIIEKAGQRMMDLTRLVDNLNEEQKFARFAAFLRMFGAAFAKMETPEGVHGEPTWIFTTTEKMKNQLEAAGIDITVITKGKIDAHKDDISYFCVARPAHAFRLLESTVDEQGRPKRGGFKYIKAGYDEAMGIVG